MELSRLEIKGFKSFADKVVVHFDRGVTGIVGPNGCGKSNVVDAIRWVLGEQKTRNLRSEKMEDVVFNGTTKRKPTQLAEVNITFKNTKNILPTEYSEVTVTRRYFRTGDSEYLLNGVRCRLKDINTLFMDTGIGPDSYSIIELKMVEDILNDNNDARRVLFEEAAGISKFKKRKKETLSKLQATSSDLERVEDLLYEIEKQMRSLERQAKKAQQFYDLKREYNRLSLMLAKLKLKSLEENQRSLKEEKQRAEETMASIRAGIGQKENALAQLKEKVGEKEQLLRTRQQYLNEFEGKIRKLENEKQLKNERLNVLRDKEQSLQNQLSRDDKQAQELAQKLDTQSSLASKAREALAAISSKLEAQRHELEAAKIKKQTQEEIAKKANEAFKRSEQALYQAKNKLEMAQVQQNAIKAEQAKASGDTSTSESHLVEFQQKTQEAKQKLEEARARLTNLEAEKKQKEHLASQLKEEIKTLEERIGSDNRKLDALSNEYDLTKALVENMEGFPEAVKFVAKSQKLQGKLTLVSDVFNGPEQLRPALENLLEPYLNYFLVQDQATALEAVRLLDGSQRGRGNFFILDQLPTSKKVQVKEIEGGKRLLDLMEYPEQFEAFADYLLGSTFIVEDEQSLPEDNGGFSFVTKDGRVVKHSSTLHGGSIGLFEGKRIGRANNLEKLKKNIANLKEQVEVQTHQVKKLREERTSTFNSIPNSLIEEAQEAVNRIGNDIQVLEARKKQVQEMLEQTRERQADRELRLRELEEEQESTQPLIAQLEKELHESSQIAQKENSLLDEAIQEQAKASTLFNELNIEYHKTNNQADATRREEEYLKRDLSEINQRQANNKKRLAETRQHMQEMMQNNVVSDDELRSLYEERDGISKGVEEAELAYYEHRGNIEAIESETRALRSNSDGQLEIIRVLEQQLNDSSLELTAVKERAKVEFEVSDLDAVELEDDTDKEETQKAAEKTKQKMDSLGTINPMAMETYHEIKERYSFVDEQRQDLIEAKSGLEETIAEIDTKAKANFMETFEEVRANFVEVFRTLFTEQDEADLVLMEEDNPLESKIEILAKPKGKRPLSISQLSGGEKTLTATSLLFALYLIKPAPFCIFDEVDAPLDDANIDKFNKIIRKFSNQSQFIIVTHNKRTMAHTDIIYGVTMQEQGVSKTIPVDIRELD